MAYERWPASHTKILADNYTQLGWEWVRNEIFKQHGRIYSKGAVQNKANSMALSLKAPEGYTYNVALAKQLGKTPYALHTLMKSRGWECRKVNRLIQVPDSTKEKIIEFYRIPDNSITAIDAAKKLGLSESALYIAVKKGYIPAKKSGKFLYISNKVVDFAEKVLRDTQHTKVPWIEMLNMLKHIGKSFEDL